jgi:hypothetical protein
LPSLYSNGIGLWCNGNTTVFGAVFLGSSPSRPTKKIPQLAGFFVLCPEVSGLEFVIWNLEFPHLDFKRHHRSHRVVYQIFADAAVKEM